MLRYALIYIIALMFICEKYKAMNIHRLPFNGNSNLDSTEEKLSSSNIKKVLRDINENENINIDEYEDKKEENEPNKPYHDPEFDEEQEKYLDEAENIKVLYDEIENLPGVIECKKNKAEDENNQNNTTTEKYEIGEEYEDFKDGEFEDEQTKYANETKYFKILFDEIENQRKEAKTDDEEEDEDHEKDDKGQDIVKEEEEDDELQEIKNRDWAEQLKEYEEAAEDYKEIFEEIENEGKSNTNQSSSEQRCDRNRKDLYSRKKPVRRYVFVPALKLTVVPKRSKIKTRRSPIPVNKYLHSVDLLIQNVKTFLKFGLPRVKRSTQSKLQTLLNNYKDATRNKHSFIKRALNNKNLLNSLNKFLKRDTNPLGLDTIDKNSLNQLKDVMVNVFLLDLLKNVQKLMKTDPTFQKFDLLNGTCLGADLAQEPTQTSRPPETPRLFNIKTVPYEPQSTRKYVYAETTSGPFSVLPPKYAESTKQRLFYETNYATPAPKNVKYVAATTPKSYYAATTKPSSYRTYLATTPSTYYYYVATTTQNPLLNYSSTQRPYFPYPTYLQGSQTSYGPQYQQTTYYPVLYYTPYPNYVQTPYPYNSTYPTQSQGQYNAPFPYPYSYNTEANRQGPYYTTYPSPQGTYATNTPRPYNAGNVPQQYYYTTAPQFYNTYYQSNVGTFPQGYYSYNPSSTYYPYNGQRSSTYYPYNVEGNQQRPYATSAPRSSTYYPYSGQSSTYYPYNGQRTYATATPYSSTYYPYSGQSSTYYPYSGQRTYATASTYYPYSGQSSTYYPYSGQRTYATAAPYSSTYYPYSGQSSTYYPYSGQRPYATNEPRSSTYYPYNGQSSTYYPYNAETNQQRPYATAAPRSSTYYPYNGPRSSTYYPSSGQRPSSTYYPYNQQQRPYATNAPRSSTYYPYNEQRPSSTYYPYNVEANQQRPYVPRSSTYYPYNGQRSSTYNPYYDTRTQRPYYQTQKPYRPPEGPYYQNVPRQRQYRPPEGPYYENAPRPPSQNVKTNPQRPYTPNTPRPYSDTEPNIPERPYGPYKVPPKNEENHTTTTTTEKVTLRTVKRAFLEKLRLIVALNHVLISSKKLRRDKRQPDLFTFHRARRKCKTKVEEEKEVQCKSNNVVKKMK